MISQVVVGVGDEDVENDPPPKLGKVFCRSRSMTAQCLHNFEIAMASVIILSRSKHAHRREKGDSVASSSIETPHEKRGFVGNSGYPPVWYLNTCGPGERHGH